MIQKLTHRFTLAFLITLASTATFSSAASMIVCKSNTVYDGKGQTIDGRNLSRVFAIANASNVTIRNYTITGGEFTRIFDISGVNNLRIENITVKGNAADVVNIRGSKTVYVRNVSADTIERYLVWVDTSDGVTVDGCSLATGSRDETGIRVQIGVTNLNIINCSIRNVLNKNTALRLHDGSGFKVSNSFFEGQVMIGPMGGDQGGQLITNSAQRKLELARRTTNVTFDQVRILGCASPLAGLSGFTMTGGSITAKTGKHFLGYVVNNASWRYPDASKVRPGDISRPAPTGFFRGVTFTSPGKSTLNSGTNGPLTPIDCTLNGKKIG